MYRIYFTVFEGTFIVPRWMTYSFIKKNKNFFGSYERIICYACISHQMYTQIGTDKGVIFNVFRVYFSQGMCVQGFYSHFNANFGSLWFIYLAEYRLKSGHRMHAFLIPPPLLTNSTLKYLSYVGIKVYVTIFSTEGKEKQRILYIKCTFLTFFNVPRNY